MRSTKRENTIEKSRIIAYYIHKNLLPLATKLMTYEEYQGFESRIIDVIKLSNKSCAFDYKDELIVVLEVKGSYPYITNEWKEKLKATQDIIGERKEV